MENEKKLSQSEYLDLFEKAMKKLAIAFDKEMSEGRFLIYFENLCSYSIEDIQYAVNRAIREEEYNIIPPVGRLIRYIEELNEKKREMAYNLLNYNEKWPIVSIEKVREIVKPFYDKVMKHEKILSEEEREKKWKENKEKLQRQIKQITIVKENVESAEKK